MDFLSDLLIVFAAAGAVVFLFQRFALPSVVGLLAAGVLVGPHGFGLVGQLEEVHLLAEIGVVVLLFAVGLEFSLSRVLGMGQPMLLVGLPQVVLTIGLTTLATWWYFGNLNGALFAGMLVAMSSTAVVIKLMADRGELSTPHGRLAVAVLLLQDLLVIVFVLAVPLLAPQAAGPETNPWLSLVLGVSVVIGVLVAGRFFLPQMLYQVVRTRNRELFLIAIFLVCIGTAALTYAVGLSLALGAFLAGLVLSESEYGHQTLAEVLPFRDTLASLFFVSVGMLLDLRFVRDHPGELAGIVLLLLLIKILAVAIPAYIFRFPFRTTVLTALALAQVGEFSFVLAATGLQTHLLTSEQYQAFLADAVLTMTLTPFLIAAGPHLVDRIAGSPRLSRWLWLGQPDHGLEPPPGLRDHVIIAGFGFNGRNLATALRDLQIPYVILEMNPETVRSQRRAGESILYGDCTRPAVLHHAGIEHARVYIVAISDPASTRRTVQIARQMNANVRVVVRTRYQSEMAELQKLGADQVVPEEFETSVEVLARVLQELDVSETVARQLAARIRADHYAVFAAPQFGRVPLCLPPDLHAAIRTDAVAITEGMAGTGRKIGELQLRTRTGASVIAVRRGQQLLANPGPELRLEVGDVVLLLGDEDQRARGRSLLEARDAVEHAANGVSAV